MNITKVQIHLNKNPTAAVRAWADIIIDNDFIVRNLIIVKAKDDTHYVNMPNKELESGHRLDVAHPINEPCRQYVEKTVLDAYENLLNTSTQPRLCPVCDAPMYWKIKDWTCPRCGHID